LGIIRLNLRVNILNYKGKNFITLYSIQKNEVMMSRAEIEYLKRVNDIRKEMGLALDLNQCNRKSFLLALAEVRGQKAIV
jgi:hypothetical protein